MPGHWLGKEGFGPAGAFGRNPSFCPPGRGAWEAQAGQAGRGAGQQPLPGGLSREAGREAAAAPAEPGTPAHGLRHLTGGKETNE